METTIAFLFFSTLLLIFIKSNAVDTISVNQTIKDGDVIESAGGFFELGFFSPGISEKRYLGIWYKRIGAQTVLWSTKSESPLTTSGSLKISNQGNSLLMNDRNSIIWSSNLSGSVRNPVAQLLDSGNIVVRNEDEINPDIHLWQSFDHPGDTLLPGMKLGWDLVKGLERKLNTWKSNDDPSPGKYSCSINLDGFPQLLVLFGSVVQYRLQSWEGMQFTRRNMTDKFVINQNKIYYSYDVWNRYVLTRMVLSRNGTLQLLTWNDEKDDWEIYFTPQRDASNHYGLCGAYGSCYSRGCQCLRGFKLKFFEKWLIADWSDGCTRKSKLRCESDTFMKLSGMRFPDTPHSLFDPSISLKQCQRNCLNNCSCTAYANMDIKEGETGCLLWFGDLVDMGVGGQDLCVRLSASELGNRNYLTHKFFIWKCFCCSYVITILLL